MALFYGYVPAHVRVHNRQTPLKQYLGDMMLLLRLVMLVFMAMPEGAIVLSRSQWAANAARSVSVVTARVKICWAKPAFSKINEAKDSGAELVGSDNLVNDIA